MEECEALCNRLVIMVKGELVCIGASQELKQRFGAGYDIHIKLNPGRMDEDVNNIKETIEFTLTCDIRDENLVLVLCLKDLRRLITLIFYSFILLLISIHLFTGFSGLSCN